MLLAPAFFDVVSEEASSAEWMLEITNTGDGLLKLASFDFDLPDGYTLRWFKLNADGKLWGPERIAGVINGRATFPGVIDIMPDMGITLVLQWHHHPQVPPPSGELRWKTNSPHTPNLVIPINGVDV